MLTSSQLPKPRVFVFSFIFFLLSALRMQFSFSFFWSFLPSAALCMQFSPPTTNPPTPPKNKKTNQAHVTIVIILPQTVSLFALCRDYRNTTPQKINLSQIKSNYFLLNCKQQMHGMRKPLVFPKLSLYQNCISCTLKVLIHRQQRFTFSIHI